MDLPTLEARLELAEFKERRALAAEVARSATPEDLAQIARLLGHDQEPVRLGAIEILALARFRPALKHLAAVTVQKTGDEQIMAARAVTLMAKASDRPGLEKLARGWLGKPNQHLKDCGARLLVKLGAASSPRQAEKEAEAPAPAATPAIPGAGITSKDQKVRKAAIERTISDADDPGQIFIDALVEKQPPGIRLDLVTGLEWLGAEGLASASLELLPRADGTVVSLLARALARHLADLPAKQRTRVRDALDLARRRLFSDQLVGTAVAECLASTPE